MRKLTRIFCKILFLFCVISTAAVNFEAVESSGIEETLMPTREMRAETIYMVRCMEELHLEHKNISMLDNKSILMDFLAELDQWKMVFMQKDVDMLTKKFIPTLDVFVSAGSLMPAFNIFDKFRAILNERINWVLTRLESPFDFSKEETFLSSRKDCSWPQTPEEADSLWERRLKFEILNEAIGLCNSKKNRKNDSVISEMETQTTELDLGNDDNQDAYSEVVLGEALVEATNNIKQRYETWRKSYRGIDSWLIQEMFLNCISKMYDPHTSFLSKDSFEDFTIHTHNSLIGIGAELLDENGFCTIHGLTPGGPAQLSGEIKTGDKIIAVAQGDDGEFVDIIGLRLYKTVKLLRGQKDTVVRIKLETVTGDTKIVRLVRDTVRINDTRASAKYFELESNGDVVKVGVIRLPSFYGDIDQNNEQCVYADKDVETLLAMLKEKGIDGLVLDLRQNGGGLLAQAISITGLFITTGPVVQVKDSFGKIEQFYDNDEYIAWKGPLVILSSSRSASASEILIGALRDHRRAIIVGAEATYGKGSVQVALDMNTFFKSLGNKDLGAAYITVQKWYLPTGSSTQLKGVPADIKLVSLDECFHRREADYPHALSWDTIPPIKLGESKEEVSLKYGVTDAVIRSLEEQSRVRQDTLEEFQVLRERIDHFDSVINRKEFPLNISARLEEKRREDAFRREMNDKIEDLKQTHGYACQDLELPDIKHDDKEVAEEKPADDVDNITAFDTNLRECLRIISDWVTSSNE